MRISKLGFLITVLILSIAIISSCSTEEKSEFINYEYKDLLGETKSKLTSQLGEKYEITTQGVNNQNTGLKYKYLGVLIGVDEISDKVVEVQIFITLEDYK